MLIDCFYLLIIIIIIIIIMIIYTSIYSTLRRIPTMGFIP